MTSSLQQLHGIVMLLKRCSPAREVGHGMDNDTEMVLAAVIEMAAANDSCVELER